VGKTTAATNLAAGLAMKGYRTCLVDTDPQGNSSKVCGVDIRSLPEDGTGSVIEIFADAKPAIDLVRSADERFEGRLSIIPAHQMLSGFALQAETMVFQAAAKGASFEDQQDMRQGMVDRLRESLKSMVGEFDACVFDTPPTLGFMLTAALRASDWLLVPLTCSDYCKDGVRDLMTTVNKIIARGNPRLKIFRAVLSLYDGRKILHQQDREFYRAQFGEALYSEGITAGVRVEELPTNKLSIFEHAPESDQARQYGALTDEYIKEVNTFLEMMAQRKAKRLQQTTPPPNQESQQHMAGEV